MRLAPDDRIGNYRIERALGQTSTGALYQVVHVVLPRRAVLKVTSRGPFAKHVLREACILEALRHPGAPQVYESGLLPDRRPWFCAEQIDGVTLVERVVQGPLGSLETALLVRDIAAVLEHAQRRGVAHRGLRPERIVLTPRRRFPICIPDWSDARGDAVDDRADIYALGAIAFLALTGAPLSGRVSTAEAAPGAPPELTSMIDQMLSIDRPSAAEVRGDLDWLAAALSSDAAPIAPIEDIVLVDTEGVQLEVPTLPRIRRPRWTPTYTAVTSDDDAVVAGEIDDSAPA